MTRLLDDHPDIPFIFGDASMGSPDTGFVSFVGTFGGDAFRNLPSREVVQHVRRFDREPFFRQLVRRNLVFVGSIVLRREVMEQVGPFNARPYGAEDWHYFMRLALRYEYCYYEGLTVTAYLQHSSNMTRNQDRMNYGFSTALELLSEESGLTADERAFVLQNLMRSKFAYAYPAYDRGDYQTARERFVDCLRIRFAWKPFVYWIGCHFPSAILTPVRRLKQNYAKQGTAVHG